MSWGDSSNADFVTPPLVHSIVDDLRDFNHPWNACPPPYIPSRADEASSWGDNDDDADFAPPRRDFWSALFDARGLPVPGGEFVTEISLEGGEDRRMRGGALK